MHTTTSLPSRCVLFADVAASTQLYERLGDKNALRAIDLCLQTAVRATEIYHGKMVKTIGDEVMVVFPTAEEGLLAACEIQQRVAALPPIAGNTLALRIGCHWGPVIEEGGDFFGDTVNTAARLVEMAKARQVLSSAETMAAVPDVLRPQSRVLEPVTVKGKREPLHIVELFWQENEENLTLLVKTSPGVAEPVLGLELHHEGRTWLLNSEKPILTLGRDLSCDLVIRDGRASRSHARIELRQQNFVLVDCSTNGTFVTGKVGSDGRSHNFLLRREEAVLRGSGNLSFGQLLQGGVESVEFRVLE